MSGPASPDPEIAARQAALWRLLAAATGFSEQSATLEGLSESFAKTAGLPKAILSPVGSIDDLCQRHPALEPRFATLSQTLTGDAPATVPEVLIYGKILLNLFGPPSQGGAVSAAQYQQWLADVARLEGAMALPSGALRGRGGEGVPAELAADIRKMEADLIKRMALREVLADPRLAAELQPTIGVVEALLRDKANLSGVALANARALIRRYVEEVALILRTQVERAGVGVVDRSVPPKRVFRNLDVKRTLWKNLHTWDANQQRLLVDRLYFRHRARKQLPRRLIVVVDQSGSMVDAMVQCTILASIFAQLPTVEARLLAFDTRVLDLTPWVSDPFEVLLRTQLGGGTLIKQALIQAETHIDEPSNTVLVLISDFYEGGSDEELFNELKSIKDSGVFFIPVGALTSSGYVSIHAGFKTRLKELGTPILTGSVTKLITQLKARL